MVTAKEVAGKREGGGDRVSLLRQNQIAWKARSLDEPLGYRKLFPTRPAKVLHDPGRRGRRMDGGGKDGKGRGPQVFEAHSRWAA